MLEMANFPQNGHVGNGQNLRLELISVHQIIKGVSLLHIYFEQK